MYNIKYVHIDYSFFIDLSTNIVSLLVGVNPSHLLLLLRCEVFLDGPGSLSFPTTLKEQGLAAFDLHASFLAGHGSGNFVVHDNFGELLEAHHDGLRVVDLLVSHASHGANVSLNACLFEGG